MGDKESAWSSDADLAQRDELRLTRAQPDTAINTVDEHLQPKDLVFRKLAHEDRQYLDIAVADQMGGSRHYALDRDSIEKLRAFLDA